MGTPLIAYAELPSRYGVTWEESADSLRIVVPTRFRYWLTRSVPATGYFPLFLLWCFYRIAGLLRPRAIIELNREQFTLEQWQGTTRHVNTFSTSEIGEVRANRFGNSLYFRIPDKVNMDFLPDLEKPLIEWIGETLTAKLESFRASERSESGVS
jgi:hypothetical protein